MKIIIELSTHLYLEKQLLLACSRDDTLKLIELRENRVIQTLR